MPKTTYKVYVLHVKGMEFDEYVFPVDAKNVPEKWGGCIGLEGLHHTLDIALEDLELNDSVRISFEKFDADQMHEVISEY